MVFQSNKILSNLGEQICSFFLMIKRKLRESDWFLIIANLLPVYGVWFLNWSARQVFLVYCLETIIVGFFTLVKLGIVTAIRKTDWWENNGARMKMSGLFFMFFFLLHYGLFVGIQTSMFLGINSFHNEAGPDNILQVFYHPHEYIGKEGWMMLAAFVFGYGYENITNFILNNDYRTKSFGFIMFEPYPRIFIQQFTVILGSFVLIFGGTKIFILIFALVKIFFTVFLNYALALSKASKENAFAHESNSSHS